LLERFILRKAQLIFNGQPNGKDPRRGGRATAWDGPAIRVEKSCHLQVLARSGVSQSEENL
jgi:hypothetical protein